ncbi:MAG: L,D-transpeptidase family protein [Deltaproteobacteria bacterium]|nr:L,D-transpeptidase family protein [Deltaproteobacteria bacterium]
MRDQAKGIWRRIAAVGAVCGLVLAGGGSVSRADEGKRVLPQYDLLVDAPRGSVATVVGALHTYTPQKGETFLEISKSFDLGYNEMVLGNRGTDPWIPSTREPVVLPTRWILPEAPHKGLVLNIPEMRLYYFPEKNGEKLITVPVGLGREDWQTPQGSFRVRGKTVNPAWVIPESIRKERIVENGFSEHVIPGGTPENPLGSYRLELTIPSYGIHGSNKPWGVGMQVSHGCLRLYNEDIATLFPLVEVGTQGVFVYQPVKVGRSRGRVLVEVHEDIYGIQPDLLETSREIIDRRGWTELVEPELLDAVVAARSGIPTDVSWVTATAPPE